MTKRDFFRILIRLFGFYSMILTLFAYLPSISSNLLYYRNENEVVFVILGTILIAIGLFLILLFKADFIIDKLRLDKGFDEENIILGDFKNEQIFKLAIILIGGFLIVDYFPNVLFEMINYFKVQSSNHSIPGCEVDYYNLIVGIINILIGLIFVANYKRIAKLLDKK